MFINFFIISVPSILLGGVLGFVLVGWRIKANRASLEFQKHQSKYYMELSQSIRSKMVEVNTMKDMAYDERNKLVVALAKCFPAGIAKHEPMTDDPDWDNVVFIDFPTGQASWHYHIRDAKMFDFLPQYDRKWDGHTTEQKYERIAQLAKQVNVMLYKGGSN